MATKGNIKLNKHIFVWVGAFALSFLGVDRFMRGQIGVGVCKLIFWGFTFGIWPLVDFLIAVYKCYATSDGSNYVEFGEDGGYLA